MNNPDGKTFAINLEPYSQGVDYNVWAGNDNIAQVRYDNARGYSYYYFLKDHLGDIKIVLNSSGGVDSYNDYYPYGKQMPGRNQTGSADGRYKYTTKERDVETGLDYFGARYYDQRFAVANSWRGQWLSVDPMADLHGDYSPYAYVLNNPISIIDPFGLDSMLAYNKDHELVEIQHTSEGSQTSTPQDQGQTNYYVLLDYSRVEDPGTILLSGAPQADGSSWLAVQHQAALEAKTETNAFYEGLANASLRGVATVADYTSEATNYAILLGVATGNVETLPETEAIGRVSDFISLGAKFADIPFGGSKQEAVNQAAKALLNLTTLGVASASKTASTPAFRAFVSRIIDALPLSIPIQ